MTERQVRRNEALRDSWFEGANEILAEQGYGALKLATLCKKLGVTTGSFYHSFDNWQDFTDALLDNWLQQRTALTVEVVRRHDDPAERLMMLAEASADLLHQTEAAIRVWAGVDEGVAAVQRKVDEGRYEVVLEAMTEIVGSDHAHRYAMWGLNVLVGFEMSMTEHKREDLLWSLQMVLAAAQAAAQTDA